MVFALDQQRVIAEVFGVGGSLAGQGHFDRGMDADVLDRVNRAPGDRIRPVHDLRLKDVGRDTLQPGLLLGKHRQANKRKRGADGQTDDAPMPAFEILDPHILRLLPVARAT